MRQVFAVAVLAALAGCASTEYSKIPEPTGEWVSANPVSLTAQAQPPAAMPSRAVWRHRVVRPVRPAGAPGDRVAAQ